MAYFKVKSQTDTELENCSLESVDVKFVLAGRNNYKVRIQRRLSDLTKLDIDPNTDLDFCSFKVVDLVNFLKYSQNDDYFVFRFAANYVNNIGFHNGCITPVLMKRARCKVRRHSFIAGGVAIGGINRNNYMRNVIDIWENRNDLLLTNGGVEDYKSECLGIAHKVGDIICLIKNNSQFKYLNVVLMFSPVSKINESKYEMKTSCAFYFDNSNEDNYYEIQYDEKEITKAVKEESYIPFPTPAVPYDNGHECCPI